MAYSEHLAERIRLRLRNASITTEKRMMGGLVFMVNNNMCVGVNKEKSTGQDRLMVRVGKDSHDVLVAKPGAREMAFTGRNMRGFLFIDPEGFDSEEGLDFWMEQALTFNRTL